ncbi:MAG: NAD-dependent epimerase/dehydratase family protein [Methanothrix sp.]|nr:MAG: NAD-dependent epimerase/dehydratase family protein [Methanothrix sp.]
MTSLNGKRVLITGATGFIGANLARMALLEGSDVYIITRTESDKWRIGDILGDIVEYNADYDVDLLDQDKLNRIIARIRPEVIYHTATYGGRPGQKDTLKIVQTNLIGTINLIKACRKFGFDLFVNTGSSSEYGVKERAMHEGDLLEPVNDYGVSKSAATQYCRAVAKNEDLPIVTLRLFSPYGSYEESTRLIPSVILSCLKGMKPKISSPYFVRDFVYIQDVLDAYAKLSNVPCLSGEVFNIGSGKQCTVGDVANKIIELSCGGFELETGAPQAWPNEPKKWEADISKANDILGWKPKYDLENGLAETIRWFEKNINLYGDCRDAT